MKSKKLIIILIVIVLITIMISIYLKNESISNAKSQGIENFPSSYRPYLELLAKKHPDWKFTPLYTKLDWNYVISQENIFGKNLVPLNYQDSWKNTTPGQYNVEVDSGWVDSSKQAVEYCMDPRNFLNEVRIFQFENLSYDVDTNNLTGIEKILYGTEFYNAKVSYYDSNGNNISMQEKYSDLILKAGKTSYVSAYHLASRIKQEVGPFLSHSSISGIVPGFEGLYNFYNIGATSSSLPMGAIKNGLQYAKDGKGASEETKNKYLIPWNTKEKSITGGGIFIGSSYINKGQNTIYLQKFHVYDTSGSELFWHQYMTNVLAPYSESKSIYNAYQNSGLLENSLNFIIPVYENMPEIPVESPNIKETDFIKDSTKVYCNSRGNVNIRTGPSTSYEILTTVTYQDKMTRIKKGTSQGDGWDKVVLENGIIGYIFASYVSELSEISIEKIELNIDNTTMQKGENKKLEVTIFPQEASSQKIIYSSSNPEIVAVDTQGNLQAIKSGKATITVKAEGSDVKSEIEITVYSKVESINLNYNEIYIQVNDSFKIDAIIMPEDATNKKVIYKVENNNIASIDSEGNILALNIGKTEIKAISEENDSLSATCILNVVRKLEEHEISFDSSVNVNNFQITGIDYNKNTVLDMKNNITTDLELEFVNYKGEILSDSDNLGTGSKIKIKENGIVLREYKIVIYGDTTGDGKINSVDLLVLQRHILELQQLEDVFLKAAIINKTNKKPTSVDLLLIQRHILGLQYIAQ